jgi:hypothetical protein
MPKLNLLSTWDHHKLSESLRLLFREILIPTYQSLDSNSISNFIEGKLFDEL